MWAYLSKTRLRVAVHFSQWDWISVNLIITIFGCKGKISESAQDAAVLDMYE